MTLEQKIEYYAGTGPSRSRSTKVDKDKTSDESWFVLIIAMTLTVMVSLITLFYYMADKCRSSDMLKI